MSRLFLIAAVFLLAVFSVSVVALEGAGQQELAINSGGQATQGTAPASDAALASSPSQADYLACSLFPASLNVQTNSYSEVAAACRDERMMCPGAGCNQVPCPPMAWVATIGSISPSGKGDMPTAIHASGGTSGSGTITAIGGGGPGQAAFSCSMPVTVAEPPPSQATSCTLFPGRIDAQANSDTQVSATCRDDRRMCPGADCNIVPCPKLSWSATIGSISSSNASAVVHHSGPNGGSGAITATGASPGEPFSCSSPITVAASAPQSGGGSGGGGGSNNGGGTFRTSTSISAACAGKPGTIKITYFDSSAPSATVEVYYRSGTGNQKVFSQTISSTTTLQFTPEKSGGYELHVSLGSDQATQGFSVQACGLQNASSTREVVNVRLAPGRELVLSKTILYAGGFAKDFRVYSVTGEGSDEYYTTEIKLHYAYGGSEPRQDFAISDSAPTAVVSKVGQISFNDYPDYFAPDPEVRFEWNVSKISKGEQISFSYSLSRPLTEQMMDSFAPPRTASISDRAAASHGPQPPADLVASLVSAEIFSIPLAYILAAFVGIVIAVIVLGFIFSGRKR